MHSIGTQFQRWSLFDSIPFIQQSLEWVTHGFKGINVDGVDIYWEVGLGSGVGYGLCLDELELASWQPQLFVSLSDFNLEKVSDQVAIDFYGNLRIKSPRSLCKLAALA